MKMPSTKRLLNQITHAYDETSPYGNITEFDEDVLDYCQSLRTTNNSRPDVRMSKVIIIGDMGVGKTSLVQKFVRDFFDNEYRATIGVDFEVEQFKVLSLPFNVQIWDTAGQERFRCIASAYYRGAHAVIVTFSLVDAETLASTQRWLNDVLEVFKPDEPKPLIFLVGIKKDLLDLTCQENVNRMHRCAKETALQLNAEYWPVSPLTGQNVNEFFFRMTSLLFNSAINSELDGRYLKTLKRAIGGDASKINLGKNKKEVDMMGPVGKRCC